MTGSTNCGKGNALPCRWDVRFATDFLRIVCALFILIVGINYWLMQFPNRALVGVIAPTLSGFVVLSRFPIPSFVLPTYPGWLPKVFLPIFSAVIGILYNYSGLRGGIIFSVAIVLGASVFSLFLTTNVIVSNRNSTITPLLKLLPLTILLLSISIMLVFYFSGSFKTGLYITGSLITAFMIALIVHYSKHYVYLFVVTFLFSIFPLIAQLQRIQWFFDVMGFILIVIWIFRKVEDNVTQIFSTPSIYFLGFLYLIWSIISFIFSPISDQKTVFKVIGIFAQLLFIVGIMRNLQTRKDFYAYVGGYVSGTIVIIIFVIYGIWKSIVNFNILSFLIVGFRATAADQSPNFVMVPVFITYIVALSFLVNGKKQVLALVTTLLCFIMIVLANSRTFMFISIFMGLILTFRTQKWRRLLYFVLVAIALIFLVAFYANPYLTEKIARLESLATGSGRVMIWSASYDLMIDHPLLGRGPNSVQYVLPQYVSKLWVDQSFWAHGKAHNVFLTESIDTGIIGFLIIALLYYNVWRWVKRFPVNKNSPWRLSALTIFLSFLIRGMFESGDVLFVNSVICFGFTPVIIMILATGEYFDKPDKNSTVDQVNDSLTRPI